MEQNSNFPTWKDALRIAKELQREYKLPIFAMTFRGSCSCCASPADFNKEAYLTKDVAEMDGVDIDSYVVLKNSCNGGGRGSLLPHGDHRERRQDEASSRLGRFRHADWWP